MSCNSAVGWKIMSHEWPTHFSDGIRTERERERVGVGSSERHYNGEKGVWEPPTWVIFGKCPLLCNGLLISLFGLKAPRQCPLVLLVGVMHMIRINSDFNFYGVRGAAQITEIQKLSWTRICCDADGTANWLSVRTCISFLEKTVLHI
jgi:hypothetical protein